MNHHLTNKPKTFKDFFTASKKTRDVTKDEISDLYDLALKMKKRAPKKLYRGSS